MGWRDLDSCGRHLEVGYEATALGLPVEHAEFDWQRLRQQWEGVMDYFDDIYFALVTKLQHLVSESYDG